jgi:hypothetical protein
MEGSLDYGAEFEMNIYYKDQSVQGYHLSLTKSKGILDYLLRYQTLSKDTVLK